MGDVLKFPSPDELPPRVMAEGEKGVVLKFPETVYYCVAWQLDERSDVLIDYKFATEREAMHFRRQLKMRYPQITFWVEPFAQSTGKKIPPSL